MIEWIEFVNFKALRKTTLKLSPFTLLLGPNGSGKSTVLQALSGIAEHYAGRNSLDWAAIKSVGSGSNGSLVKLRFGVCLESSPVILEINENQDPPRKTIQFGIGASAVAPIPKKIEHWLSRIRVFSLEANKIARPTKIVPNPVLEPSGEGFAAVADDLHGNHPERWDALIRELKRWLPEYDNILFETCQENMKSIALRTKNGAHRISAKDLSQGTLIALALLTLAYLPEPPTLIGLEEIDRGLHPRLLRQLQDALYRLSYPQACKESRPPTQVIATTHSPYLLDLFRDHPEEVVLASKEGLDVEMKRLTDVEHFNDILGHSPLSEVWYSGVLGGVPAQ